MAAAAAPCGEKSVGELGLGLSPVQIWFRWFASRLEGLKHAVGSLHILAMEGYCLPEPASGDVPDGGDHDVEADDAANDGAEACEASEESQQPSYE